MSETVDKPKKPKKKYYDNISVAKRTKQKVHLVAQHDKASMLERIIEKNSDKQIVVVTKSKRRADEIGSHLKAKEIRATEVHGNHRAEILEAAAKAFNEGKLQLIVTTDMILQALNLNKIELIISYELPAQTESYLSRLAYLKEVGESISFVSEDEERLLNIIELTIKEDIPQEEVEGFTPTLLSEADKTESSAKDKKNKPRHRKERLKTAKKTKEK